MRSLIAEKLRETKKMSREDRDNIQCFLVNAMRTLIIEIIIQCFLVNVMRTLIIKLIQSKWIPIWYCAKLDKVKNNHIFKIFSNKWKLLVLIQNTSLPLSSMSRNTWDIKLRCRGVVAALQIAVSAIQDHFPPRRGKVTMVRLPCEGYFWKYGFQLWSTMPQKQLIIIIIHHHHSSRLGHGSQETYKRTTVTLFHLKQYWDINNVFQMFTGDLSISWSFFWLTFFSSYICKTYVKERLEMTLNKKSSLVYCEFFYYNFLWSKQTAETFCKQ